MFGRHHPRTFDEHVPLDRTRLLLALFALVMFALCFTPAPIEPLGSYRGSRELQIADSVLQIPMPVLNDLQSEHPHSSILQPAILQHTERVDVDRRPALRAPGGRRARRRSASRICLRLRALDQQLRRGTRRAACRAARAPGRARGSRPARRRPAAAARPDPRHRPSRRRTSRPRTTALMSDTQRRIAHRRRGTAARARRRPG